MQLLLQSHVDALIANYGAADWCALAPVVKLFTPDAAATWLLATLDPDDHDTAWGLCDLGLGFPELGTVSLGELASVRGKLGLPVERDLHVTFEMSIGAYADTAHEHGRIII